MKKKKLKKKVKKANKKLIYGKEYSEFNPYVEKKVKGVHVGIDMPIGGEKKLHTGMSVVEWVNGEGFDFSLFDDNNKEVNFSLHMDDVFLMLLGLEELKFFE